MLSEEFLKRFNATTHLPGDPLMYFKEKPFKSFRINTLKTSHAAVFAHLDEHNIHYQGVDWCTDAFIVDILVGKDLLESALCKQGLIYAQGLESMLAAKILDPKPGQTVLDLCAAPGSKTTHIAALMNNQGNLLANEVVRDRFFRLKSVVDLMGAQAKLICKDGRFFRGDRTFDKILVDAPCSSEGRFNLNNPKSYAFWSVRKIHEMAHKQKGLLLNASRLLKKGGTLVYATCTYSREENEEVVEWFLKKTEGQLQLQPIEIKGVASYPSSLPATLRVLPNDLFEGFFLAKFISP